jgi:hypothetical protein
MSAEGRLGLRQACTARRSFAACGHPASRELQRTMHQGPAPPLHPHPWEAQLGTDAVETPKQLPAVPRQSHRCTQTVLLIAVQGKDPYQVPDLLALLLPPHVDPRY